MTVSRFAQNLLDKLPVIADRLTRRQVATAIDLALLRVAEALGHARHRDHAHSPHSCRQCYQLQSLVDDLKIR